MKAPKRPKFVVPLGGNLYSGDVVRAFGIAQAIMFGSATFGAIVVMTLWAVRSDDWTLPREPAVWMAALRAGGLWFWVIAASAYAQIAWELRSWFWLSTLLPGLVIFPALWLFG